MTCSVGIVVLLFSCLVVLFLFLFSFLLFCCFVLFRILSFPLCNTLSVNGIQKALILRCKSCAFTRQSQRFCRIISALLSCNINDVCFVLFCPILPERSESLKERHDYSLPARLRSRWSRIILRMRMDFGVTSTYSSALMYSRHSSSESTVLGMMRALSSVPEARTLVSCFAFVTLMTRSLSWTCSPTTCPQYTSSPGSMKNLPRSCSLSME